MSQESGPPPGPPSDGIIDNAFAMMIPGRPLNRTCKQISKERYLMEIPNPGQCKHFGVSILNLSELPKDLGFTVYYSLPPFEDWQYIGTISYETPTQIFESPWQIIKKISTCPVAQIGFELKPLDFLKSLDADEASQYRKKAFLAKINEEFAMKVAKDLFNYLNSFVKTSPNGDVLLCPANCLDKWHDRFTRKYILDPKFMM